jgi:hypothetical protein
MSLQNHQGDGHRTIIKFSRNSVLNAGAMTSDTRSHWQYSTDTLKSWKGVSKLMPSSAIQYDGAECKTRPKKANVSTPFASTSAYQRTERKRDSATPENSSGTDIDSISEDELRLVTKCDGSFVFDDVKLSIEDNNDCRSVETVFPRMKLPVRILEPPAREGKGTKSESFNWIGTWTTLGSVLTDEDRGERNITLDLCSPLPVPRTFTEPLVPCLPDAVTMEDLRPGEVPASDNPAVRSTSIEPVPMSEVVESTRERLSEIEQSTEKSESMPGLTDGSSRDAESVATQDHAGICGDDFESVDFSMLDEAFSAFQIGFGKRRRPDSLRIEADHPSWKLLPENPFHPQQSKMTSGGSNDEADHQEGKLVENDQLVYLQDHYSADLPELVEASPLLLPRSNTAREAILAWEAVWRQHAGENSRSSATGAAAQTSRNIRPARESHEAGKPPGKRRNYGEDDDPNEDGEGESPKKRTRPMKGSVEGEEKSLACPYAKKDNLKHGACSKATLKRIQDVKQHLHRTHEKIFCPRCEVTLSDEEELREHAKSILICPIQTALYDGITKARSSLLRGRVPANLNQEQQWFTIWDILFPGQPRPKDPYVSKFDPPAFLQSLLAAVPKIVGESLRTHGIRAVSANSGDECLGDTITHGLQAHVVETLLATPPIMPDLAVQQENTATTILPSLSPGNTATDLSSEINETRTTESVENVDVSLLSSQVPNPAEESLPGTTHRNQVQRQILEQSYTHMPVLNQQSSFPELDLEGDRLYPRAVAHGLDGLEAAASINHFGAAIHAPIGDEDVPRTSNPEGLASNLMQEFTNGCPDMEWLNPTSNEDTFYTRL